MPPRPHTWPLLHTHVEHMRRRVLQDALAEATARYWRHRADQFAAVGTPACDLIAANCRRHARLLEDIGLDAETRVLIEHELQEAG